jgi:hypothetical protein
VILLSQDALFLHEKKHLLCGLRATLHQSLEPIPNSYRASFVRPKPTRPRSGFLGPRPQDINSRLTNQLFPALFRSIKSSDSVVDF